MITLIKVFKFKKSRWHQYSFKVIPSLDLELRKDLLIYQVGGGGGVNIELDYTGTLVKVETNSLHISFTALNSFSAIPTFVCKIILAQVA